MQTALDFVPGTRFGPSASIWLEKLSRVCHSIHPTLCSDGDDARPWFLAVPISGCAIRPLADNLKGDPAPWRFGVVNDAFASVDAGREFARGFAQCLERERL